MNVPPGQPVDSDKRSFELHMATGLCTTRPNIENDHRIPTGALTLSRVDRMLEIGRPLL